MIDTKDNGYELEALYSICTHMEAETKLGFGPDHTTCMERN